MPSRVDTLGPIDLQASSTEEIDVPAGSDLIRVQAITASGTWGAAELEIEMSLVGGSSGNWTSLDEPLTLDSSSDGVISTPRYLGAVRFLRARVTTTQAGACEVEVTIAQDATWLGSLRRTLS